HTRFDCDWSSDVCSSDLLSNGSGCQRHAIKGSEGVFKRLTQFCSNRLAHGLEGDRWGGILQCGQLALVRGGQQIVSRGEHLAQRSEEHTYELQSQSNLVC